MNPNTDNPLFEDRKELLERQSQEYKNALLGEVHQLKDKSRDAGKKLLIAGGALAVTFMLARAYKGYQNGREPQKLLEYKGRKKKKNRYTEADYASYEDLTDNASSYDISDMPHTNTSTNSLVSHSGLKQKQKPDSLGKDIFNVVAHQLTAYLIILGTRKLEEYLNARKSAPDTSSTNPVAGNYGHSYAEPTYTSAAASDIQSAAAE